MNTGKQRSVVITGSSTGIGEAAAIQLAREGWKVFAGVRKELDAKHLQSFSDNIHPIFLDVTDEDQIISAFEEVREAVGAEGLDVLVNNAGVCYMAPSEFMLTSDLQRQFDINVFGPMRVTQAAMPLLRGGDAPGRIINIGSNASRNNFPYCGAYCASKSALESLSEALRREVARWGIRVSLIRVGPVKTNMSRTTMQLRDVLKKQFPPGSRCNDFYGIDIDHIGHVLHSFKRSEAPSCTTVNVIKKVMNAKNPKNIYYDRWRTYFSMKLLGCTPVSMVDCKFDGMFFVKD